MDHSYKCLQPCLLIIKIYTLLGRKHLSSAWFACCSPLFFVSRSSSEKINYIFSASAASHHKDASFVCFNKDNLNQKTVGFRLLPLSPAAEINDGDKQARTWVSRPYCLCLFTQPQQVPLSSRCDPLSASTRCFTCIWQLVKLVFALPTNRRCISAEPIRC